MRETEVALGGRSYPVRIEAGALTQAGEWLAPFRRTIIVSDENVWAAQGGRLGGLGQEPIVVPAGEGSKSWTQLEGLCERLLALGVARDDTLVAFGGGVIGDLVGFAAAILKRGCRYVQVPTSLLAQVDSSVGGKTAINAAAGKNLIGAFHQPALVLIDPDTLDTLPARELRSGYAEVVKYGLIGDPAFFEWCEANGAKLLAGGAEARIHAIATCVAMKAEIVAEDERETEGRRALLNFGHTYGHAIEAETDLRHGEAVAIGMATAFRLSVERGLCPPDDAQRAIRHLQAMGLPTETDVAPERLEARMRHDKKGGQFVLTRGIGKAFLGRLDG
ncbi:MAG TPA: 3-dehydroquinate synthase [Allosphingosinicella sp.]|nr:3-dehydroquinate synthase [Allosphingosinicella sp.]